MTDMMKEIRVVTMTKIQCACGCGELVNFGKKYVRGHNSRNRVYRKNLCYEKEYIKKVLNPILELGKIQKLEKSISKHLIKGNQYEQN
jgi:hypothetical protein